MTDPVDPGAANLDDVADGGDVVAPEANNWWQFANKDDAVKWGNDLIAKRLTRHKNTVVDPIERERDTLKAEVERLQPYETATKTEAERREAADAARQKQLDDLLAYKAQTEHSNLVRSVADELGLPASFVPRVRGKDEAEVRADITDLLDALSEGGLNAKKVPPAKAPKETEKPGSKKNLSSGGGGTEDESDDDSVIAEILGQVSQDRSKGGLTTRR